MKFDLHKLRAANLPLLTCELLGVVINVREDFPDQEKARKDRDDMIAELDEYLKNFTEAVGGKCPGCNWSLGGLLGSFTWGIQNGEGFCSECGYPCRANHNINGTRMTGVMLPYHPSQLELAEASTDDA
jgi:hypothetical protein